MEKIDQKLDQWIYNSIIRAEVRKVIEDYILDIKAEAFKAGCEQYANQRVVEELEKLLENESNEWVDDEDGNEECGVRIVYSIRLRDRIKELKQ